MAPLIKGRVYFIHEIYEYFLVDGIDFVKCSANQFTSDRAQHRYLTFHFDTTASRKRFHHADSPSFQIDFIAGFSRR